MDFVELFLSLVVGLFIYAGSLCGIKYLKNKNFLDFIISLTFEVIVTLLVFILLPDSFKIIKDEIGLTRGIVSLLVSVLIGFFLMKIFDIFIKNHSIKKKNNDRIFHLGLISSIAFMFLNIINGINIYSSSIFSSNLGLYLIICICNIPIGLFLITTLSKKIVLKKSLQISLVISSFSLFGSLIVCLFGINNLFRGILSAILLGVLVYISVCELLYQIYSMKNKNTIKYGIFIGVAIELVCLLIKLITV